MQAWPARAWRLAPRPPAPLRHLALWRIARTRTAQARMRPTKGGRTGVAAYVSSLMVPLPIDRDAAGRRLVPAARPRHPAPKRAAIGHSRVPEQLNIPAIVLMEVGPSRLAGLGKRYCY